MEAFDYFAPRSVAEVYQHLGNGKTTLMLAGGTDVIVQLREGRRHCDQLIDLKHIPELVAHGFASDGTLVIGAAAPLAELYEDPEVRRRLPGLVDAASLIGGIQIQSRASLGGNLCNASPAADSSPALIALGARLVVGSKDSTRELPVEEFFAGPGRNTLQPGEILLQVKIPPQPEHSNVAYLRFIPRNEMDIAVASAGVRLELHAANEAITGARLAIGAVAATTLVIDVSGMVGRAPGDEAFAIAAAAASAAARPIDDMRGGVAQRTKLAGVLTTRAFNIALQRIGAQRAVEAR
jgi:xanthine dehydrogenase FAD-binding subunit